LILIKKLFGNYFKKFYLKLKKYFYLKLKKYKVKNIHSKKIGINPKIWDFTIVCEGATIGDFCNICSFCFIENDVIIGNNVTIKTHNSIWDGVIIEDNVFIG